MLAFLKNVIMIEFLTVKKGEGSIENVAILV